jgi:hypothetical protein
LIIQAEEPDELDYFNGIHDDQSEQPFSIDMNDNGFEKISTNDKENDIKTESVKVFVKSIKTNGLINVERRADDANDVFLLLRYTI